MDVFANTILPETMSHFYLLHLDYKFKTEKLELERRLDCLSKIFSIRWVMLDVLTEMLSMT